jgi:hypothetical protein
MKAGETQSQCKQFLLCMWHMWANLARLDTGLVGRVQEILLLGLLGKSNPLDKATLENHPQKCNTLVPAQDP